MSTWLIHGAVALLLALPAGQAPDTTSTDPRRARADSAMAAALARQEAELAARRRLVDSLNATQRTPPSAARDNRGPLHGYRLAFYANLVCGAIMGLAALLLRHRDAPPAARRVWALVGIMLGTVFAALAFMTVAIFFTMLSVGFNPMPTSGVFAIALLATAFAIAWLMSLRFRRMR